MRKTLAQKKYLLLALGAVGLLVAGLTLLPKGSKETTPQSPGPVSSEPYKNNDFGLLLNVPKGWTLKKDPQQFTQAGFFSPKESEKDRFIENVSLHISDLSVKPDITIEEVVKSWTSQSQTELPDNFKVLSQEKTTLGTQEAVKLTYTAKDEISPLKGVGYFLLKDGVSYVLVYSAEEKSFNKFLPDVNSLINSFSLGPQNLKWETYKNEELGFSVEIPSGWKVTNQPATDRRETSIVHPQAKALVLITALKDEKLKDLNYMKSSIAEFKAELEKDPNILQLAQFKDQVEDTTGGFIAIGEEKREGKNWYFEQRGLLGTSGKVILFHGAAQSSVYKAYKEVISRIIESFKTD